MNSNLIERILRRLLKESQEEREERGRRRLEASSGMAAYVYKEKIGHTIVLYDPAAAVAHAQEIVSLPKDKSVEETIDKVMLGIIEIGPTYKPCNGAYEIIVSAVKNKGDGGILYGLAYALSPGQLTSDRNSVSQAAQKGWADTKKRQPGKPFDDVYDPKTSDPSDDCELHKPGDRCRGEHIDVDSLNRSYNPEGWESPMLSRLEAAHHKAMEQLPPEVAGGIQKIMYDNTRKFFNRYHKY